MEKVTICPACAGTSFRPYSFTVESERDGDMHYAQTRCQSCDLVFSNPVANAQELEHFYRTRYYEEHEPVYDSNDPSVDRLFDEWARSEAEGLRSSVLPYVAGGTFFEIGAGYGRLLAGARLLGFSVAGVEPSERAAAFARDVMRLKNVRHSVFDADDWPAEFCDVIYSFHVIEHVSDLHAFVGGMFRMLKPGGLAVVGTENHHNAWVDLRHVRSWLKGRWLPEFQTASHHTFYFSSRSLRALLERHGFAVIERSVYTPSLAEKLPRYRFRSWLSRLAFYGLHYADAWTGRGNRLLVWGRKPSACSQD